MKHFETKSVTSLQTCTTATTLPVDYPPSPPPKDAKYFHPAREHSEPDVPSSPLSAFSTVCDTYSYQYSPPSTSTFVLTPSPTTASHLIV